MAVPCAERNNRKHPRVIPFYYKGDRAVSQASGYVLLGWKSGKIERVPIQEVRLMPSSVPEEEDHGEIGLIPCFPGMKGYRVDLPKQPFVDNSVENQKKMAQARSGSPR